MKQTMIDYMKRPKYDEYFTPVEAIKPLLPFIRKPFKCWEPCDPKGTSNITRQLKKDGHKVACTGLPETDFLGTLTIPHSIDVIITNPPYSLKNHFLERCVRLDIPFCLLLPITTLEGKQRGELFRKHGIQVLVLDKRIQFIKDKSNWFNVSWFCSPGILPRDLVFAEVKEVVA
jgi:hypothetical protein